MNTTRTNEHFFREAIENQIKIECTERIEKAIEEVTKSMRARLPEIIAGMTVRIMRLSEFRTMEDRVVFTIRTDEKKQ